MERLAEAGAAEGGVVAALGAYARSDTFSLFLFSRPVVIISILGCRGSPNIEPVLIDQACINKPRPGWQQGQKPDRMLIASIRGLWQWV